MNKLLEAEDILTYARDHIECVFMAAGQLTREEGLHGCIAIAAACHFCPVNA